MRFVSYASSSKANCYEIVADNGKRLLIDAGLAWGKMREAIGYDLRGIECWCISHQHL